MLVSWIGFKGAKKHLKKTCHTIVSVFLMKMNVLCILINQPFIILPVISSWGVKRKGKGTVHHIKKNEYCAHVMAHAHVPHYKGGHWDMPEDFGSELSRFISGMRRTVEKYIHNRVHQSDMGNSPLYFPIYTQMGKTMYSSPNTEHVFSRAFLTMEWSLVDSVENFILYHVNSINWRNDYLIIYF